MTEDDTKPTPDPTVLTTEQLLREITTLKEWVNAKYAGLASDLNSLEELMIEKFSAVDKQQGLTEGQRLELKLDTEKALTAALQAAKEAVSEQNQSNTLAIDKAVAGMKELIINNAQVSKATTDALADKIEDLKTAVDRLVNTRLGAHEQRQEQRAVSSGVIAVVGIGSAVLFGVISAVFTLLLR